MSRPIMLHYSKTGCHFHGLCIADVIFLKNRVIRCNFHFFINFGYVMNCDELTVWRVGSVMTWLWRFDCVMSWPCDELTGSHSNWSTTRHYHKQCMALNCRFSFWRCQSVFFCFCTKYLANRWTDLRQIHTEDMFGPSFGRVWRSRSKVSAACVRFMFGKTSLASSFSVRIIVWNHSHILVLLQLWPYASSSVMLEKFTCRRGHGEGRSFVSM